MQNNWGILGSGFGSYGYLPAIIKAGYNAIVPERYLEKFRKRADLHPLIDRIKFCGLESEIIRNSNFLVFARRPEDQDVFIQSHIQDLKSKSIFFEKPLSQSNEISRKNLELLSKNKVKFRIGFLSKYTNWCVNLQRILSSKQSKNIVITLKWQFDANHFKYDTKSWKGLIIQGGGTFYFYGSHLIHAFSQLANWDFVKLQKKYSGPDTDTAFELSLANQNWLADINVNAYCNCDPSFRITVFEENTKIFDHIAPSIFDMPSSYEIVDPRSELIYDHIQSIDKKHENLVEYMEYLTLEKKCLMSEEM